ncbi:MAG: CARDB domain-containing protein [Candidatus Zixiibacteriota bacterium]
MKKPAIIVGFVTLCFMFLFSQVFSQQQVFKIKLNAKSEKDILFFKEIGLDCSGPGVCVCEANILQSDQLRAAGRPYTVLERRIDVDRGGPGSYFKEPHLDSISKSCGDDYDVLDFDTTYSTIEIAGAPPQAKVQKMDVRFDIVYPRPGELIVDLTNQDESHTYNLLYREAHGEVGVHYTETDIPEFNAQPVNSSWKLRVYDDIFPDTGYIDRWGITIWFQYPSDVTITSLTASDSNPTLGEAIDVAVIVRNDGAASARYFCTGLFLRESSPPLPGTRADLSRVTDSLEPGETEVHLFTGITNSTPESWNIYGLVDFNDQVIETDEENNLFGPAKLVWRSPTDQPDLAIQALSVSECYPVVGESISAKLVIQNLGNGDASYFWTELFENSALLPTVPCAGDRRLRRWLSAGQRDSCIFEGITSLTPAIWHMYGLVDSHGEILESNEANNLKGPLKIEWQRSRKKPDMIVYGFCIANNTPEVGDSVHILVGIKNQGLGKSSDFFLSLFYNRSLPPSPPHLGDDYLYVPSLAPGEVYDGSFYIGNDTTEVWSMYVLADSWSANHETDEENNLYGPHYVDWSYPPGR